MMLMLGKLVISTSQRQDKSNATDEGKAMYYSLGDICLPKLIEKRIS